MLPLLLHSTCTVICFPTAVYFYSVQHILSLLDTRTSLQPFFVYFLFPFFVKSKMTILAHSSLASVVFNNQVAINTEPYADLRIISISTL